MNPATGSADSAAPPAGTRFWAALLIALAGAAVYARSFSGPFVFDDVGSILENPTIRHWSQLSSVLSPPAGGLTVSGRPLLNLSLAINYAFGGTSVAGYHAVNLAIHILAGLTLFAIARRTIPGRTLLAFAIALIWTVHPLQTEAVSYTVQRAESLMGLWYLLTLYGFIRFAEDQGRRESAPRRWLFSTLSAFCCLLGMATKEVMVSAPVVALLYDRAFLSGSFREAWRQRRAMYLGLAGTWILLVGLVIRGGGGRSGSVGFGVAVSWWDYGLTQFEAIVRYLWLAVCPQPLVFEYGTFWVQDALRIVPYAVIVVALLAATIVALWRWPAWGFLGFWFFAILAPTSLVPGTTQMIVEHRMYLALIPVLAAIVCGGDAVARRIGGGFGARAARQAGAAWFAVLILFGAVCGALTIARNEDYRSEARLWADTVAKRPQNALAHNNLGAALAKLPGRTNDAIAQYQATLQLNPNFPEAHNNLANAWLEMSGKLNDAIAQYQEALRLKPDYAEAHNGLANAWSRLPGRADDAIAEYQTALRLKPQLASAHSDLGSLWLETPGKTTDAIAEFQEALRLNPDFAEAHNNLGKAWASLPGRLNDGIAQFEWALRLKPEFAEAHNNLGNAWSGISGKRDDAIVQIQEALRLKPDYPEAHNNLGNAWANTPGKLADAIAQYREALRLKPDYAEAHFNLAVVLLQLPDGRDEAKSHLETFLRLRPDNDEARRVLATLQASPP